jgi:hypothetical protein
MKIIDVLCICFCLLSLPGCRQSDTMQENNQIVWRKDGCAYVVRHWSGDSFFIKRLPDQDLPPCKLAAGDSNHVQ